MANAHSASFLAICSIMLVISSSVVVVNGGGDRESIGECLGGNEFELDSEINRRILATSQYISYGALQRNTVPCSRRGASYYNCRPGAQANPYNRGCSAITRCRS
ncbi:protein RALF-like 33 [Senna tora]|uniref:Protein RALF-like 33 n=1 Tax=Senna tora TaxID=362788 RepID=A0A834TA19_9FABA|nr:protein RALF-like 33 [Senna tora]